jgi:hypothetical protein
MKKIKKILYSILFIGIIFLIMYYIYNKQNLEGMTISSGSMRGYIKRKIHPSVRKIRQKFDNPKLNYYTNKLNQILR